MTDSHVWAFVALAALTIAATVVVFVLKSILPIANALNQLQKLNGFVDQRVDHAMAQYDRLRNRAPGTIPTNLPKNKAPQPERYNPLADIFPDAAVLDFGEQPDSEAHEVVES